MRQGQNRRMRGRNRKGPNPLTRSFESNGPDVKIRGTALHIAEKYLTLARDAASSGDRVAEQNYLQHAEHYYRIIAAAQAQMPQPQPIQRSDEEFDDEGDEHGGYDRSPAQAAADRQGAFGSSEPQPFVNGTAFNGYGEVAESRGEDEGSEGEPETAAAFDGTEQRFRSRNRRSGRGRPRPPQGDYAGAPEPARVPASED
jgi:hypothetical protein